ncbi:MAG TPA: histidinol dehydrogenase [Spirochaetota bacterium]|mgnify:CR=1 FL=1|nr:histidinol dehydrogenase [Spirochaetota bacterium]HPN83440.1 histidinol dehydrogenase [Spirochaetota bacterium]
MDERLELRVVEYGEARTLLRQRLLHISRDQNTIETVAAILGDVAKRGDAAVLEYTSRFDGVTLDQAGMQVRPSEIEASVKRIEKTELGQALRHAAARIRNFHERQLEKSWIMHEDGAILGQVVHPLSSAGLYVPGGKAPYPSTVLMNAIPATVAGVRRLALCTPANHCSDAVLYAASIAGVTEIWKVGGAQAIAALALGTESIQPVDKITGPGNRYVAEAKRQVFGLVDIDMVAGPSEILVLADETSDPDLVVRDLFSQAEHDQDAGSLLVSTSQDLVARVNERIEECVGGESRAAIITESIRKNGMAILVPDLDSAWEIINLYAPEHLEILATVPLATVLSSVRNAGAIFYGNFAPEPLGDYIAGPNHTLPTAGTARYASPLGVYDFQKRTSLIAPTRELYDKLVDDAARIAHAEGFMAHEASVLARKKRKD